MLRGDNRVLRRHSSGARSIPNGSSTAKPLTERVENRHAMNARAAVSAKARLGGVGADDGEGPQRGRQGEAPIVVLQQNDRRTRRLASQRAVVRVAVPVRGAVGDY